MRQLEILATPSQARATPDKARAAPEGIGLRNHLIRFEKVYPFEPGEPRYLLRIEAQLPGVFHLEEVEEILKSTSAWRWGELHSLGQLGILIERAIARTEKGRSSND